MYQRQVSFSEAINMGLNQYCTFSGRASRSEYWWFALFTFLVGFVAGFIGNWIGEWISGVASLALLLPSLGLQVRRLHDIGKAGGWIFIGLIPIVGQILLLIWDCTDSEMQPNRFGDVPNVVAA